MQSMVLSRESISSVYALVIPVSPLFATSSFTQSAGIHPDSVIGTALQPCAARAARVVFDYLYIYCIVHMTYILPPFILYMNLTWGHFFSHGTAVWPCGP